VRSIAYMRDEAAASSTQIGVRRAAVRREGLRVCGCNAARLSATGTYGIEDFSPF